MFIMFKEEIRNSNEEKINCWWKRKTETNDGKGGEEEEEGEEGEEVMKGNRVE